MKAYDRIILRNNERMLWMTYADNVGSGASGLVVQTMSVHLGVDDCGG